MEFLLLVIVFFAAIIVLSIFSVVATYTAWRLNFIHGRFSVVLFSTLAMIFLPFCWFIVHIVTYDNCRTFADGTTGCAGGFGAAVPIIQLVLSLPSLIIGPVLGRKLFNRLSKS
ncbi:MAG: hypothetical protein ACRCY3_06410 [Sphingorhabdus sp.]